MYRQLNQNNESTKIEYTTQLETKALGDFTFWLSLWLRPKAELKLNLRAQLWSEPGLRIKYWLSC